MNCVCIYGAGKFGIDIYYQLKRRGIQADLFADKDKHKWGYLLDGIYCVPSEDLLNYKRNEIVIIVSMKNSRKNLLTDFKEKGFTRVYTRKDVLNKLSDIESEKSTVINDFNYLSAVKNEFSDFIYGRDNGKISDQALQRIADDFIKRKMNENIGSEL